MIWSMASAVLKQQSQSEHQKIYARLTSIVSTTAHSAPQRVPGEGNVLKTCLLAAVTSELFSPPQSPSAFQRLPSVPYAFQASHETALLLAIRGSLSLL